MTRELVSTQDLLIGMTEALITSARHCLTRVQTRTLGIVTMTVLLLFSIIG